jgi:hypothetical protein
MEWSRKGGLLLDAGGVMATAALVRRCHGLLVRAGVLGM